MPKRLRWDAYCQMIEKKKSWKQLVMMACCFLTTNGGQDENVLTKRIRKAANAQ